MWWLGLGELRRGLGVVPESPRAQRRVKGVTGKGKCWSGKKMKKAGVGGIMVLCLTRLYTPVLALRTSQSLRVRNPTTGMLFLIRFTKTHFLHPPNYGYWDVSYIVGKV